MATAVQPRRRARRSTARCRPSGRWPAAASCRRSRAQAIPAGPARALAQAEEALRGGRDRRSRRGPRRSRPRARAARWARRCSNRPGAAARWRAIGAGAAAERAAAAKLDPYAPTSMPWRACATPRAPTIGPRWRMLDEICRGRKGCCRWRWRAGARRSASRGGDKKRAAVLREGLAPVTRGGGARSHRSGGGRRRAAGRRQPGTPARRDHGGRRGGGPELDRGGKPGAARGDRGRARADGAGDRGESRTPSRSALLAAADRRGFDRRGRAGDGVRSVAAQRSRPPGGGRARAGARPGRRRPAARIRWRRAARCRPRSRRRRARRCSGRSRRRTRARGGKPTRRRRCPTAPTCGARARSRPGCARCALSHLSLGDPGHAFEDLRARLAESPAPPPTRSFELEARARLAERAGDPGALAVDAGRRPRAPPIPIARRRWRRAGPTWSTRRWTARGGRASSSEALEGVPDDPSALALLLLEDGVTPAAAGEALWRAGAAAADGIRRADRALVPARGWRRRGAGRGRRRRGRPARPSWSRDAVGSAREARADPLRGARARPTGAHERSSNASPTGWPAPSTRRRPGWRWRSRRRWPRWAIRAAPAAFRALRRAAASPPTRGGRSRISTRRAARPGRRAGAAARTARGACRRDRRRGAHRADGPLRCGARRKLGRRGRVAARRPATRGRRRTGDAARGGAARGRARQSRRTRACWKPPRSRRRAAIPTRSRVGAGRASPTATARRELRVAALELAATRFALDQAKVAVGGRRIAAGPAGR